jgi:hypothetical protein
LAGLGAVDDGGVAADHLDAGAAQSLVRGERGRVGGQVTQAAAMPAQRAITTGRRSTIAFHTRRAWS